MNKKIENEQNSCICGSGLNINVCCAGLINSTKAAMNAEQLMRSRYTAFALGEVQYILSTWHKSTRPQRLELDQSTEWVGLNVLRASVEKGSTAYVEFIAYFRYLAENGQFEDGQMQEKSCFVREAGIWFYKDGEQIESTTQIKPKKTGRNEPCHCGSGHKYKKCCGK